MYKKTTEFYNTDSKAFEAGPELPYEHGVVQHCLAWKNDDVIMVVGGMIQVDAENSGKDVTGQVFEFNTRDESFTLISSMNEARESTGCQVVDTDSNGKELVVVAGRVHKNIIVLLEFSFKKRT